MSRKIQCQQWIVTAPWYDSIRMFTSIAHRRKDAIKDFMANWIPASDADAGLTWQHFRRQGWRCEKATVTWSRP